MTDLEQNIYFAGCFDCDGCGSCSNINGSTPRIRLSIANNELSFLELFKNKYGGRIAYSGQTCNAWATDAKDEQLAFLTDIRPFTFIKHYVTELAWEFLQLNVGGGGPTSVQTREARWRRKEIAVLITNFNHRFEIARGDSVALEIEGYR